MKIPSPLFALFCTLLAVNAASLHDNRALAARHVNISHRTPTLAARAPDRKRCKARPTTSKNAAKAATNSPKPSPTPKPNDFHSAPADNNGVINVPSNCGPIGATRKTTRDSGPNGSIHWLNCGLTGGGWNPPHVEIHDLILVPLTTAIEKPSSPFKACRPFIHLFEKYGNELGIPGIILASFAMQESSCNPNTVGGGGEQGLMQITQEKCGGAPGRNCRDPEFNVRTGARFFAKTLKDNGNNVILAAGTYNGWRRGLTFDRATAAAKSDCCRCQNNCDYLHQFFNGWLQNIDAYNHANPLGIFFNLNVC